MTRNGNLLTAQLRRRAAHDGPRMTDLADWRFWVWLAVTLVAIASLYFGFGLAADLSGHSLVDTLVGAAAGFWCGWGRR